MKIIFAIDYAMFAIRMCKPHRLLQELASYMQIGRTIPENRTNRPIMADKFRLRTYCRFPGISKAFILHSKIGEYRYHDALLFIHDVPFYQFQQIEMILQNLLSVQRFHLSTVEHRWDFYPMHATEFQLELAQHLHLKHSRSAMRVGKWPRFTFYINEKPTDVQVKHYIRPKEPNSQKTQFVRLELTSIRRWLRNNKIQKPSDYLRVEFVDLIRQLQWLEIDFEKIGRSILNIATNNLWFRMVNNRLKSQGISNVIISNKRRNSCPRHCIKKSDLNECPLNYALRKGLSDYAKLIAINDCRHARPMSNFQSTYCKQSKYKKKMNQVMKSAYEDWKNQHKKMLFEKTGMIPLYPNTIKVHTIKRRKRIQKQKPDFVLKSIWKKNRL